MIEISGLSLNLGGTKVLDNLSISSSDGEIVGITGPAGSGKSSLLRAAAGKLKPSRGSVFLNGNDIYKMSNRERERSISYFSGLDPLNREDTVENFVLLSRACLRGPLSPFSDADRETAAACMADLGIERIRNMKLGELCKNDLVLAMIAHALAREARALVLDDPGRFLDLESLRHLHKTLARTSARARTAILFATNDINFTSQVADRIAVMHGGKIAEEGKPSIITAELVRQYFGVEVFLSKNIYNGRPEVHFFPVN